MDDMAGLAERLPAMSDETRLRLERALMASGGSETAGERAELIAKRDALLETAGVHA